MADIDRVGEELYDLLSDRFHVEMRDEKYQSTVVPKEARFFEFQYIDDGVPYAVINIGIFPNKTMNLFTDQSLTEKMDDETRRRWYKFIKNLRMKIAAPHRFRFDQTNFTKGKMKTRDMIQLGKDAIGIDPSEIKTPVRENKLYGSKKSSYQKMESVKLIVRHSKPVEEDQFGSRTRNINKIFVETETGERFLLPEGTSINGARAYARHIKNGGTLTDDFGKHISQVIKEMNNLRAFVRNMRGRSFEDIETSSMVEAAIDHYGSLHKNLFSIRSQKGYQRYKENWTPSDYLMDDADIEDLKERFTRKVFDDRFLEALPIVAKAYKSRRDEIGKEFESWTNSIAEDIEQDDVKSPFANSIDQGGARGNVSDVDKDGADEELENLLNQNGFDYKFLDGKYWFESKGEVERAKDIMAQADIDYSKVNMGVFNYGYGNGPKYGSSSWEYQAPGDKGVHENADLSLLKSLAGLTK